MEVIDDSRLEQFDMQPPVLAFVSEEAGGSM
jgi:hypothetical protein